MKKTAYIWLTDLHLNRILPWTFISLIQNIVKEEPTGVFLTGDISNGLFTCFHLKLMARFIKCPIYFVLGNHDYYFGSIEKQHAKVRKMCQQYSNLIWITDTDMVELSEDVALIGIEGWYDVKVGNPKFLNINPDWLMIDDLRSLPSMKERIVAFRKLANTDTAKLEVKLEKALDAGYKTVFILTHFPPWKEATRQKGSISEKYYLPYNTNYAMGQMIERVMGQHRKQDAHLFSGHTHQSIFIRVSRNINCQVGDAKQLAVPHSQMVYV